MSRTKITTARPVMPNKPEEFIRRQQILNFNYRTEATLKEIISKIPADIEFENVTVMASKDEDESYSDVDVSLDVCFVETKPNPRYEKELKAYEKKLEEYHKQFQLYQAEKDHEKELLRLEREKLKPTLTRIEELENELNKLKKQSKVDDLKKRELLLEKN